MYDIKKFVNSYYKEALNRLDLAKYCLKNKNYNTAIRECQEACEILSKALLISVNQIIPEKHNLRIDLKESLELFSEKFQKEFEDKYYKFLGKIRNEREISYYGDLDTNTTPNELYTEQDAKKFINDTENYINIAKEELCKYLKNDK
jgi:HEPN domain-containing protein